MKQLSWIWSFLFIAGFFFTIGANTSCANMIPPTGGPKDTLPPVLVSAQPVPRTLNFTGNRIIINFDEFIDLKDVRQSLIVSPVPKIEPQVESKLRTITMRLKDTLQPNTTYSFNFGNAVRDINEGNILRNYTYVFSTGKTIDSLTYSGRVVQASTGKPDSTLVAMLYDKIYDSAVAKERPRYIARVDSNGNFKFRYVKAGTYALFAMKDESGQHIYTSPSQTFAFADSTVHIGELATPMQLYAFADTSGLKKPKKINKPVAPPKKKDKDEKPRIVLLTNAGNSGLDLLDSFKMGFQVPIRFYDSSKIRFTTDSFVDIRAPYHWIKDSLGTRLTLAYKVTPDTKYHLILQKDFAEDTLGNHLLKIDTLTFFSKKESDYGNVKLRFRTIDLKRNPVLQFVQQDVIKYTYIFGNSRYFFNKLFIPGEYNLRILYDDNKNGVWDPGNYFANPRKQPEIVVPITRKLTIRSNWDNEADISL